MSQALTSTSHSHKHLPPYLTVTDTYLHISQSQTLASTPHSYKHLISLSHKYLPPYLTVTNILQSCEGSCQGQLLQFMINPADTYFVVHGLLRSPDVSGLSLIG